MTVAIGRVNLKVVPLPEFAFDGDLSSERFHQPAHKSQSQARSGIGAAGESSEDGAEPLGFDASSVVPHEKLDAILDLRGLKNNGSTFRGISKGIHHEIVENTPHGSAIGVDVGQVGERLQVQVDCFCVRVSLVAGDCLAQNISGAQPLDLQCTAACLQLADLNQVCHEVVQLLSLMLPAADQLSLQGSQFTGVAPRERIERESQLLQGIAKLFRGYREETRLEAIDFLHFGHVFRAP